MFALHPLAAEDAMSAHGDDRPVLHALDRDVGEVEKEVLSDSRPNPARRIHTLLRETLSFEEAVEPLHEPVGRLVRGLAPWVTLDLRTPAFCL